MPPVFDKDGKLLMVRQAGGSYAIAWSEKCCCECLPSFRSVIVTITFALNNQLSVGDGTQASIIPHLVQQQISWAWKRKGSASWQDAKDGVIVKVNQTDIRQLVLSDSRCGSEDVPYVSYSARSWRLDGVDWREYEFHAYLSMAGTLSLSFLPMSSYWYTGEDALHAQTWKGLCYTNELSVSVDLDGDTTAEQTVSHNPNYSTSQEKYGSAYTKTIEVN